MLEAFVERALTLPIKLLRGESSWPQSLNTVSHALSPHVRGDNKRVLSEEIPGSRRAFMYGRKPAESELSMIQRTFDGISSKSRTQNKDDSPEVSERITCRIAHLRHHEIQSEREI